MQPIVTFPELNITSLSIDILSRYNDLLNQSGLKRFCSKFEVWSSNDSNRALAYSTHGIFRYFGKFPPPIARYLIQRFTDENDMVIDPMCGSGTTALEALLLNRRAVCFDINPLAVLITKAKVTYISESEYRYYYAQILNNISSQSNIHAQHLTGLRDADHWFLKETADSLESIRVAINETDMPEKIRDVFLVIFLSIIRRVSRATTQQGRLFLDIETAEKDALPFFVSKASASSLSFASVPQNTTVDVKSLSILDQSGLPPTKSKLVICHPPYFNNYKYSSINSLELAWMGIDRSEIRKSEVREAFKVGKEDKVTEYVDDMSRALSNIHSLLENDGVLGLMIGDTVIRGKYIPVTGLLLARVAEYYRVEAVALRVPKFTEASWAASQRRNGDKIGINMCDFVITLRKK